MKLRLVTASSGLRWMRQGVQVFWRQPIALSGLFFMFMLLLTLVSMLPVVGAILALVLFPACSLGLMAATQEVVQGRFPMPRMLLLGLLGPAPQRRQMLWLGAIYALGLAGVLGLSAWADGGEFARLYLGHQLSGKLDMDSVDKSGIRGAALLCLIFYIPLSVLFWHAPALVHWHGVAAVKSLFFSLMACLCNWKAMLVFIASWAVAYFVLGGALLVLSNLLDSTTLLGWTFMPLTLLLTTMFFCSSYFSFRDSFQTDRPPSE